MALENRSRVWPTPEEYGDALLNPHTALLNNELKRKQISLDAFGQPLRLNSGGTRYVCVYRLDDWVIRCFAADPSRNIFPPPDIEERYHNIITFVQSTGNDLAFLVPNKWTAPGIRVKANDFPILRLKYLANGKKLGEYLAEHYQKREVVSLIAQDWLKIIQLFEDQQVAHSDLDLTNVLVWGTYPSLSLRMVDFDGMYVPYFEGKGMSPADAGHRDFQPAQPGIRKFNAEMDRFSALIIYLSLYALEMNPSIWVKCKASERRLLLGRTDFEHLAQSNTSENFKLLRQEHTNSRLQLCLEELEESIKEARMPRSLREILGIYVPTPWPEPPLREVLAIAPPIPIDEVWDVEETSKSGPLSSSWRYTPAPRPLTVPLPILEPEPRRPGLSRGWIIAIIVIIVIIVILAILLIAAISQNNSTPQQYSSASVLHMVLSLPLVGMTNLVGENDTKE